MGTRLSALCASRPQIGFLQEILRWWDHWLKGVDTGMMDEPMLRAWMTESVKPATHHATLPGRWIAEPSWPPQTVTPRRLFLTARDFERQVGL
jgi:predicted acyl esterase